ncbi:MAG: HEAT repeat domain-containing protein [Polyangiaceae bacterium]|nr:HEAT repeat domain-containing protein [Polyangiaceae bacterium]
MLKVSIHFRRAFSALLFAASLIGSSSAHAALKVQVATPGTGGQAILAVGFDKAGQLFENVCLTRPCAAEKGQIVALPESVAKRAESAEIRLIPIGLMRHAIWIRVAEEKGDRSYHWLATAPLRTPTPDNTPQQVKVLFSDWTDGNSKAPIQTSLTLLAADKQGNRSLLLATEQSDRSLCGRRLPLQPKVLDPESLSFLPARVPVLGQKERTSAVLVQALAGAPEGVTLPLEAVEASSGELPNTKEKAWFEDRKGDGSGEYLMFRAPAVPLTGLAFALPPSGGPRVGPGAFWVASAGQLLRVELPKAVQASAVALPFQVSFPAPISGECLAIVLDRTETASETSEVGFVALTAQAEGLPSLSELVADLGKAPEAQAKAVNLLSALGTPALTHLTAELGKLNDAQLSAAGDVLARFSCAEAGLPLAKLLGSASSVARERARARLDMCGKAAALGLAQAFSEATSPEARAPIALELAQADPEAAVAAIGPHLLGNVDTRQALRTAFARAARAPSSGAAVRRLLAQPDLSPSISLELLRALGPLLPTFLPEAGQAYTRARNNSADFSTRFLLLEPAGYLEATFPLANADLKFAINQREDWRLRAQAAASIRAIQRFEPSLLSLAGDTHVRVREAALGVLADKKASFAEPALAELLHEDPWPLVRSGAARALSLLPGRGIADEALTRALRDDSVQVRARAAEALGARRTPQATEPLIAHMNDPEEALDVRVAAASALGEMCATSALQTLTQRALELTDLTAPSDAQLLGRAALRAVVRLNPADLKARLSPLLAKPTPAAVRAATSRALSATLPRCAAGAGAPKTAP